MWPSLASVLPGRAVLFAGAMLAALQSPLGPSPVLAQNLPAQTVPTQPFGADPLSIQNLTKPAFPKPKGGVFGGSAAKIDKALPLHLQGDELLYDSRNQRVIARGNVEIYYNNYILTADEVIYDQKDNRLTASGNAQLKEPNGNIVRADKLVTTDDFRDAFVQSLSIIAKDDTRITAERATRREGNVTVFEKGKFTPCRNDPGTPPLWCISAAKVTHDQQAATISYEDAQFELFGQPIFYLPYFSHPDPSVKRKSGFLVPEYSNSTTLGFATTIPYYFALAPNYDFTFNPMYTSKQGVLWQGEWRHRLANGRYSVKFAGINELDPEVDGAGNRIHSTWRGSIETKGQFDLGSWWKAGWDLTFESDDAFRRYYKLDNILQSDRINSVYLRGLSDRNYIAATFYHFGGLQFDDTSVADARVHPVIDYNYIVGQSVLGGEMSFGANAIALTRSDGTDANRLTGEARWRRKIVDGIGQVFTPFAQLRGDVVSFSHFNPAPGTDPSESVARGMATAGLTYSYPFVAHTANASHILEPTAQIIARPETVRQRNFPDEDAKSLVFDDTLLFDVDKFSGYDRLETGTRANVGVQYTFQGHSGGYLRAVVGQSYHLAGVNPYSDPGFDPDKTSTGSPTTPFSPTSGLDTAASDYVAGLYLAPFSNFRMISQSRFDETNMQLRRQDLSTSLAWGPLTGQAIYTYKHRDPLINLAESEQEALLAGGLQLTDRWSILAAMRYDIDRQEHIQDVLQLKYADECFVLTATYTATFIEKPELGITPDKSVMLRFELKHLGGFNYKTDALDHLFAENQPRPN